MRTGNLFILLLAIVMGSIAALDSVFGANYAPYAPSEGKRAVTVRVDDVRGVAAFVLPGDRVDIVLTVPGPDGASEDISEVMLQHVRVLAVDQLANEQKDTPTVAMAVALELDTDQAQKILPAINVGKLSLILRQAGDSNPAIAERGRERDCVVQPWPGRICILQSRSRQEPVPIPIPPPDPRHRCMVPPLSCLGASEQ